MKIGDEENKYFRAKVIPIRTAQDRTELALEPAIIFAEIAHERRILSGHIRSDSYE